MKSILFAAGAALALCACATTTSSGPPTSWGKAGVSKQEYGNDVGMCTGLAAQAGSGSGVNTAGGVSGKNSGAGSSGASEGGGGTVAGGTYQGMASSDYAQRAATQQRSQEMAAKRARTDAYKSCLTERGYKEFTLTAEQRAHLASLPAGSNEYHEYLYSLGTDPAVVNASKK
jgi:hypothetical protein